MATFMTNLWESVFTPGPTPTLLIATNATFGTLQVLLFILLITTSSIHFVILSVLCAGLWYSINWFAREVQAAKAAEEAAANSSRDKHSPNDTRQTSPDPTGSDTETETDPVAGTATGSNPTRTTAAPAQQRRKPPPPQPGQAPMPPPTSAASSSPRAPAVTSKPAAPRPAQLPTTKQTAQHLSPNPPTTSAIGTDGSQDLSAGVGGRRRPSMGDSSGYVSTDSEWEKVSDQEGK